MRSFSACMFLRSWRSCVARAPCSYSAVAPAMSLSELLFSWHRIWGILLCPHARLQCSAASLGVTKLFVDVAKALEVTELILYVVKTLFVPSPALVSSAALRGLEAVATHVECIIVHPCAFVHAVSYIGRHSCGS